MSIQSYELFCRIAELGNMSKAAEIMCITPSAATHAINNLEKEIGLNLLIRTPSKVVLSPEGERLYPYFKQILESQNLLCDEIEQIRSLESGSIRLGAFSSVIQRWIPKAIEKFHKEYPNIKISIMEGGYEDNKKWILNSNVDLGFISASTEDSRLQSIFNFSDRIIFIGHSKFQPQNCKFVSMKELNSLPVLIASREEADYIAKIKENTRTHLQHNFSISHAGSIASLVEKGYFFSITPELYCPNRRNISTWPIEGEPYRTIALAKLNKRKSTPAMKEMATTLQDIILNDPYFTSHDVDD